MKRSSALLSLALACSIFILSCVKHHADEAPLTPQCDRINQIFGYTYPSNTPYPLAKLSYDSKGRISTVDAEANTKLIFTYFNDHIDLKTSGPSAPDISITYNLDDHGRITGTSLFNNAFQYNNEGYLVSFKLLNGDGTETAYKLSYEAGNLKEIRDSQNTLYYSFTYYDRENQDMAGLNAPILSENEAYEKVTLFLTGSGFFGKQSKNLVKNIHQEGYTAPDIKYQFDDKGRVISKSGIYSFNYECK